MKELMVLFQAHFAMMCSKGILFRSTVTGREVWDLYLSSFSPENDPMFRDPESSEHNCNNCNNFIRRYGNIVAIDENNKVISLFDVDVSEEYADSFKAMSKKLRKAAVANVFLETFNSLNSLPYETCSKSNAMFKLGMAKNVKRYTKEEAELYGVVKANEIRTFHHFNLDLPKAFVDFGSRSIEAIQGDHRSNKDVFLRGLSEIPVDTLELVRDLINQGSLLNGDAHIHKVEAFLACKRQFDELSAKKRDNWAWVNSHNFQFAKFRNELIGVLCTELAEGKEINDACKAWNYRVDPANYMKAVAPITNNQKKMAQKFVEENDYVASFDRRFATIDDIKANEIKHINAGDGKIKSVSMFDNIKTKSSRHKRNEFKGVEEFTIEKFMEKILPSCTSVEAYLENRLEGNMVTMTTSKQEDCKQMFKWDNPYSWTYKGNLAGKSQIKEAVKAQGGKVDGVLRFSIMWSEGKSTDNSDLDAHCVEPSGGQHIYYSHKRSSKTGGNLDIDITQPQSHKPKQVVENITYPSLGNMIDGTYKLYVRQYSARNSQGFTAEIEFNGELFQYTYDRPVSGNVQVAEVTLKNGEFTIKHILPSTSVSKELYGLDTQEFHKVNLVCLSPNHWGNNKAGNKHYMFMLDGCKSQGSIRSFHSENLEPELSKHRKVLEVLGAVNMLESNNGKQLSGLGFNATVKDEIFLRLKGSHQRVVKVKF